MHNLTISKEQAKEFAVSCFDVLIKDIRSVSELEDTAIENATDEEYPNAA